MQEQIRELVAAAQKIVVVQADNPDADSLGSALALEHILGDLGKDVYLYCGVDVPTYLRYLDGWDRVMNELPSNFDLSVIVDASTYMLFDQLEKAGKMGTLRAKPCIVLDHHATVDKPLDFAKVMLVEPAVGSTGELIYNLAKQLDWPLNVQAAEHIMSSILGDTQGLMNDLTQATTYRAMADLTVSPRMTGKVAPYLLGGVGVQNGKSSVAGAESDTKFAWNAGAGLGLMAGSIGLFIEGRFLSINTEGAKTNLIPITVGIKLGGH